MKPSDTNKRAIVTFETFIKHFKGLFIFFNVPGPRILNNGYLVSKDGSYLEAREVHPDLLVNPGDAVQWTYCKDEDQQHCEPAKIPMRRPDDGFKWWSHCKFMGCGKWLEEYKPAKVESEDDRWGL